MDAVDRPALLRFLCGLAMYEGGQGLGDRLKMLISAAVALKAGRCRTLLTDVLGKFTSSPEMATGSRKCLDVVVADERE